jgi:hypothetical protein
VDSAVAESLIAPRTIAGVRYALATPADDADVRRLLRENPMPGRVQVSLEREPDARIAAAVEGDVHHAILARDAATGDVIAVGGVSVREMFLNGEPARVGYLGQLRLDQRHRPRASVIVNGYRFFRELHERLGVTLYLTSIAADNLAARRLLERGLAGMPTYRPLDRFVTHLLSPRAIAPRVNGVAVAPVAPDEVIDCLNRNGQRFQFAPAWTEAELIGRTSTGELRLLAARRRGRVVGCVGVWDQSAYKQAVIRGYAPAIARWRRWINVAGRLVGTPPLPPVGTPLELAYLSHLAVDGDDADADADVFAALLSAACRGSAGQFVLGLSERHPLAATIPRSLRRHTYRTQLYAVHFEDGREAVESLDARSCQPEVALL